MLWPIKSRNINGMDIFLFLDLVLTALAASVFSRFIYRRMQKKGRKSAMTVGVLCFIGSFVLLNIAVFLIAMYNMRFER